MKRALLLAALASMIGCDGSSSTGTGDQDSTAVPASVVVVDAVRGRQGENVWYITPDLQNEGGAGEFYIHVQGVAQDIDGPLTECGLTQTIGVAAGWRDTLDFVFECARAPQYLTVRTRDADSTDFRITDEYVY